ncbi:MAG: hypothetical protein AAFY28_10140 [Actinomycetota bacterium]
MNHLATSTNVLRTKVRRGSLLSALLAATLVVGAVVTTAWNAGAAGPDSGSVLVQITPCRITDTRPSSQVGPRSTPLTQRDTHVVAAHGANGECQIPVDAVGLSLNVTTLNASEQTYVTIWGGGDQPLASSLNPAPGQPPTPNAVVTPLDADGAFRMYNHNGSVDAVVDVNGYYRAPDASTVEGVRALIEQHAAELAAHRSEADAMRTELSALVERLDDMAGDFEDLAGELAAERSRITALENEPKPAVISDFSASASLSANELKGVVELERFTAPDDGNLVITATGWVASVASDRYVTCSVTTTDEFNGVYASQFEPASNNQNGVLVGHRVLWMSAGDEVEVAWRCVTNDNYGLIVDPIISATFTPWEDPS